MSLTIDSVFKAMDKSIDGQGDKIEKMLMTADSSDELQMARLKAESNKYDMAIKIVASFSNDLKDALNSVFR